MTSRVRVWRRAGVGIAAAVFLACGTNPTEPGGRGKRGGGGPVTSSDFVLIGAGDINYCGRRSAVITSDLVLAELARYPNGLAFTAGDNAYDSGTTAEFACYDQTWGRFKNKTRPAPGNHDYVIPGAPAYYAYFGPLAGPPGLGYYAFDHGNWRVISMNSEVAVGNGSPQMAWLKDELANHRPGCSVAIFHRPLFTDGPDGPSPEMRDIWRVLFDANVDIIINGHEHLYERYAPQDPDGRLDVLRGIRQFIVGTGGADSQSPITVAANREFFIAGFFGVLKLTLRDGAYNYTFVGEPGSTPESGVGLCH